MTDTVPEYLSVDLFEKVISNYRGESIKIKDVKFKVISSNGDNYCSNVYRVCLNLEDERKEQSTLTLIVKDLFKEIAHLQLKELDMYNKVLKGLSDILKTSGNDDLAKIKFSPYCLLATREFGELYIFEDLTAIGYEIGSRWQGVSEKQSYSTIKKLAQFHATSMVLVEKNPSIIDLIKDSHFKNGPQDFSANFVYGNIESAIKYLDSLEGFEDMAKKVRDNCNNFSKKIQAAVNTDLCQFKVLNHADLWVNNILFNSEDDAVFLDYQLSFYGSPGIDLNFFLHTSVRLQIVQSNRYKFLRYYYNNLKLTLKSLKYENIPTFEQLIEEVRRTEFYSFYAVAAELPLMCLTPEQSKTMSVPAFSNPEIMEQMRMELFSNERVRKTLEYSLDRLNELGVLD
ncbi:uncharacterized protein LOC119672651 [Teleopsis dalmanni]|uniref:uncharacterized protein LOC119672651 n=1 Tax=Teleopsis dalmanni TaxID=139649 RepID=UPI0018CC8690|nr:uncharacterized protein LOC119672651 [Teleopsis dalmanni]